MAKRRKKDEEEEDYDFDMPEFDREQYMKDQINEGKATLISVAIAPLFSVVSMLVFDFTGEWIVGLFAGLLGAIVLKPIFETLKIKIENFGVKGWLKNVGVYSLTLLAIWVVLMNPPISDYVDPSLDEIEIEVQEAFDFDEEVIEFYDDNGELIRDEEGNINISYNDVNSINMTIQARITSNVDIAENGVNMTLGDQYLEVNPMETRDHWFESNETELTNVDIEERDDDLFVRLDPRVHIEMEDVNGNTNSETIEEIKIAEEKHE